MALDAWIESGREIRRVERNGRRRKVDVRQLLGGALRRAVEPIKISGRGAGYLAGGLDRERIPDAQRVEILRDAIAQGRNGEQS